MADKAPSVKYRRCPASLPIYEPVLRGQMIEPVVTHRLPCELLRGHEGHHRTTLDGKPYVFQNS